MQVNLILLLILVSLLTMSDVVQSTVTPTKAPTAPPTYIPTRSPARLPVQPPSLAPVLTPSRIPTINPTSRPSSIPTLYVPSPMPTGQPTSRPTTRPSIQPTRQPTGEPSSQPSRQPTYQPTNPTGQPSSVPTYIEPTSRPTMHTRRPTLSQKPTASPSIQPTSSRSPTAAPSTTRPSIAPTRAPTSPTGQPSTQPSGQPSRQPYAIPSARPSSTPTNPTSQPSSQPTLQPFAAPSIYPSSQPTKQPTGQPTRQPTSRPTWRAQHPYKQPTTQPSSQPSTRPSNQPSNRPSGSPTNTKRPTNTPSGEPSYFPVARPSARPSNRPSTQPTSRPTKDTTKTVSPTVQPTVRPTAPTGQPTGQPTRQPSGQPTSHPTVRPSAQPSRQPTSQPSSRPSHPSSQPSTRPSTPPSAHPSARPSYTHTPTSSPSSQPSSLPSSTPSTTPSYSPTNTGHPTPAPSSAPVDSPTSYPTRSPTDTLSPTAYFHQLGISGYVLFSPDTLHPCFPLELTLSIRFSRNLTSGSLFVLNTPGLTSGPCYSEVNGKAINSLYLPASSPVVSGRYSEGVYVTSYETSKITFTALVAMIAGETYTVRIDRSNELRRTCSANDTWTVTALPTGKTPGVSGYLDRVETYPRIGYLHYSEVNMSNAQPHFFVDVNISFRLAFPITRNTKIRIRLPHFTNQLAALPLNPLNHTMFRPGGGAGGSTGGGSGGVYLYGLSTNTPFSWTALWYEGAYANDLYADAYLELVAQGGSDLNTNFWVKIPKSRNHLIPICGLFANSTQITISVNSTYFHIPEAPVQKHNGIGQSCDAFRQCSGHGTCNGCLGTCECFPGYGSPEDQARTVANTFTPDCAARACPVGPALGGLLFFHRKNFTTPFDGRNAHRPVECSNNGLCDRASGQCVCSTGYGGAACEKQLSCGGPSGGEVCSGRGVCYSQRRLSNRGDAFPLSHHTIQYRDLLPAHGSWDGDFGHRCLCDSSWPVGLGPGQVQVSEYFGPVCQYRHCPSGDDPVTRHADETNCEGKAMGDTGMLTGSYDVGMEGNLCQVDCSNHGICDYDTGICACQEGFMGLNCGQLAR